jgi:CheY-like chemotaxis protein
MGPRHITVLLVDDNESHRYATSRELAAAGHTVMEAATGSEALQLARQLPQVILLDVNLPDFDGFEVCRRLKADPQTAFIPVIFLSATCPVWEGHADAAAVGGITFLTHPIAPDQLLSVIAGTMQKAKAAKAKAAGASMAG